ncbi:MAG: hypothetical protein NZ958_04810 [Bacteroidia bacterium]|nr:hypothetical protein [Bacteroidia bacterium]MDW8088921.1 hypothetical protein [Bacteroidia bacterium]
MLRLGLYAAYWWWRLELRQAHGLAALGLFILLLGLAVGLAQQAVPWPLPVQRWSFWIAYVFALFQGVPRALLERRSEEWRWLFHLFPPLLALAGLWLYAVVLALVAGLLLAGLTFLFWRFAPSLQAIGLGGIVLVSPLLLSAYLTARAEASYVVGIILAFPLLFFPLLLLGGSPAPAPEVLLALGSVETLLFFLVAPYLWQG